MRHDTEFTVVFIICAVLIAGAATRALSRRIHFPYTVAMMLLGLGVGQFFANIDSQSGLVDALLQRGANISPHLILFVFLPALVFESAYSVDQHAFWKERGAVGILAGPALLLSTALIAGGMFVLTWGVWDWSMTAALVFGALISATDPVAVVAILREVNAPKRLGVLIEGESLLNDGTAIVVFMVLVELLAQTQGEFSLAGTLQRFAIVVSGGIAVGLIIGLVSSWWMARTFNDPLVEISFTFVVAYLAMLVAEGMLHVSGVIAIVVAALWLGGRGRTATSPEVAHFQHQFWEMLAYIANTLIFFLVGLVVAKQLGAARVSDLFLVAGAYILIVLVRFAITYTFRPLLAGVGSPLSPQEAGIISWGGLRGAVSLALALLVSQRPEIDAELSRQIMLTTAGVVLLTVFVNGATAGWVMGRLGLTRRPASERLARLSVEAAALGTVAERLEELSTQSGLRAVDWTLPLRDLDRRRAEFDRQIEATEAELADASSSQRAVGYWHRALSMERREYWAKFGRGTLSPAALRALLEELDRHQDSLAQGDLAPPRARTEASVRHGSSLWQRLLPRIRTLHLERLALLYDIARAEAVAAGTILHSLAELREADRQVAAEIRATYERNLRVSKQRVEEMRIDLPELVRAIEVKLARRIQLNLEREEFQQLARDGSLGESDGQIAVASVEERMKRLSFARIEFDLPSSIQLCRANPLFAELDDETLQEVAEIARDHVLAPGEAVVVAGERGTSAFIVVRGAAEVVVELDGEERVLEVLGAGEVFGEIALLTGERRTATVRAATALTLLEIGHDPLAELMERQPGLRDHVWRAYARRRFDNTVRDLAQFGFLDRTRRLAWIDDREQIMLAPGSVVTTEGDAAYLFVVTGELNIAGDTVSAPAVIDRSRIGETCIAKTEARIVSLPRPVE